MIKPHHAANRIVLGHSTDEALLIVLQGFWHTTDGLQSISPIEERLRADQKIKRISFEADKLEGWDTSLIAFLGRCQSLCHQKGILFDTDGLPDNIKQLLFLSHKMLEEGRSEVSARQSLVYRLGVSAIEFAKGFVDVSKFIGELTLSLWRIITGKGQTRWKDFILIVQQTGAEALPIVSLISFLVGFIMAFVAFTQLQRFGATIYVADLVGFAVVREMGAMMAGIILCGRTGAAFAATIGSMKVGEEIDALRTTGISPFDFLVTPRVLALIIMMPMLCLYADFIGIFGGFVVSGIFSDITSIEYWRETQAVITMKHISIGVYKSVAFGILIALTGCLRGMQCGSSSSSVGDAVTSAVVTGITSLVVADAIFALLFDALNM